MKYNIKNVPYKKLVHELPEKRNKDNLVTYEYHKAFESVDFPRWDLFYNNKHYGPNRNSYYDSVAKKMGFEDGEYSNQKTKPIIREKLIQSRVFSTLSSYFWAATGVAVAMQKPWEHLKLGKGFVKNLGKTFAKSCKEFVNHPDKATKIAGRSLLGAAVGMTLLGNFVTLLDFNKDKGSTTSASTSLFDESKEKVVC